MSCHDDDDIFVLMPIIVAALLLPLFFSLVFTLVFCVYCVDCPNVFCCPLYDHFCCFVRPLFFLLLLHHHSQDSRENPQFLLLLLMVVKFISPFLPQSSNYLPLVFSYNIKNVDFLRHNSMFFVFFLLFCLWIMLNNLAWPFQFNSFPIWLHCNLIVYLLFGGDGELPTTVIIEFEVR